MSNTDKRPSREASGDLTETREEAMDRPGRENSGQVLSQLSCRDETPSELQIVESMPTELMQMIFCFVDSMTLLVAVPAVCKLWRYHCAHTRVSVCGFGLMGVGGKRLTIGHGGLGEVRFWH